MFKNFDDCWDYIKSSVRETDMFGHSICFNYKQEGETYNTYTGGFFSVFVKLFLVFYVGTCFKKMLYKEDDTVLTFIGAQDLA